MEAAVCPLCDSPLRNYEWVPHVRDCLKIAGRRTGRTDAEIIAELREHQRALWGQRATAEQPFPFNDPS